MTSFKVGPTGALVQGDVLDVNKHSLELKLKEFDPQLYLKWNPKKRRGMGIWELRRKPEKKTAIYVGEYSGIKLFNVDYLESDLVHHVKDLEYLDYSILNWLKKADTWTIKDYTKNLEQEESDFKDKYLNRAREERLYMMKQERKALNEYKEKILSGVNPNLLGAFWGRNK